MRAVDNVLGPDHIAIRVTTSKTRAILYA